MRSLIDTLVLRGESGDKNEYNCSFTCFAINEVFSSLSFIGVKWTGKRSLSLIGFPLMGHLTFSSLKDSED